MGNRGPSPPLLVEPLRALNTLEAGDDPLLADAAETVMVSLPTPDIVLKVATGPDGVIEGKRVRRFVDLSTTGSVMAQRIFKLLAEKNIVQIDAPVSGGVRGAAKGTVAVMASGPRADVAAVEPALKVIGKFFYIGERPGAGRQESGPASQADHGRRGVSEDQLRREPARLGALAAEPAAGLARIAAPGMGCWRCCAFGNRLLVQAGEEAGRPRQTCRPRPGAGRGA